MVFMESTFSTLVEIAPKIRSIGSFDNSPSMNFENYELPPIALLVFFNMTFLTS